MKTVFIQMMSFLLVSVCLNTWAENLPGAGSSTIHSISKAGTPVKFNEDDSNNTLTGLTFSNPGSCSNTDAKKNFRAVKSLITSCQNKGNDYAKRH